MEAVLDEVSPGGVQFDRSAMRQLTRVLASAVTALAIGLAGAPAAEAAVASRRVPVAQPSITIVTPELLRIDKQDGTNNVVVFGGMDAKTRARVNWGDGSPTEAITGRCSTRTALAHADWCSVPVVHEYSVPGQFTITAIAGRSTVSKLVTISPAPVRWAPPAGFVQPSGWSLLNRQATYFPCQTVYWYYDRTGQPANGGQIYADTQTGLAMLAAETGLTFTETSDPAASNLTFNWGKTGSAGLGGGAYGSGRVTYDSENFWPTDNWPGFGIVTQPDGSYALGHGWLAVHEVMHALGLGHVNDVTSIMNPLAGATRFNPADLDAMHTLYLNNACPVG